MDKTQALQNLLNGTASEEEINLLKHGLVSGEISIGGNVNHSVIIIGSGNTVELTPEALDRLNARPLLGDLDRDLVGEEIALGLERLESELPQRAPVLLAQFQEQYRRLRPFLKTNPKSLSEPAQNERLKALAMINGWCMETLDISFNALCLGEEPPEYDSRSPFRGLESFRPEDSEFFFGREVLTRKLVGKINSHSFLAVLGASGSGKSSLVMAGLIPALGLDYVIFRPGIDPLGVLESAKEKALIVVDQFEELFTLTRDEATRVEFIAKLLDARQKIVITLRSDFLGEVGAYRALSEEIQSHLEIVPPMNMDELRRAMEGQAGMVGLRFEADLSQQILDDVEGEPGAMPLLQHALWELWNRRHGRNLRASEYRAFGGVKQAITSTAEKVYGKCTKAEQEQMRDIFLRLTRLDDGDEGRDTRRRVPLGDLIPSGQDTVSITLLLDKLANARLIVETVNDDKTEIEVAHEALIRHWERLRAWLNEDRDNLRLRESVSEDAARWENVSRDESFLNHRGGRLELAVAMSKLPGYLLNRVEQAYLDTCVKARDKIEYEKEEQRHRELLVAQNLAREKSQRLEDQRQANEKLKRGNIWLVTALISALILAGLAVVFGLNYSRQIKVAQARTEELKSLAIIEQANKAVKDHNPDLALALAMNVTEKDNPSSKAYTTLLDSAYVSLSLKTFEICNQTSLAPAWVTALDLSPDDRQVAVGCSSDETSSITLLDLKTGQVEAEWQYPAWIYSLAFGKDGQTILAGYSDAKTILWNLDGTLRFSFEQHAAAVSAVTFSPDGQTAVTTSYDKTVALLDINNGEIIRQIVGSKEVDFPGKFTSLDYSKDGKKVALGDDNGGVYIWNIDERTITFSDKLEQHDKFVLDVAFTPDGSRVLSGAADSTIAIWNINDYLSRENSLDISKAYPGVWVRNIVFTSDGTKFLVALSNGMILLWDSQSLQVIQHLEGYEGEVENLSISSDGSFALSGGRDGTVRQWDLQALNAINSIEVPNSITGNPEINSIAMTKDDSLLVGGSANGFIHVWNLETNALVDSWPIFPDQTPISEISLSSDGKYLLAAGSKGQAFYQRLDNHQAIWEVSTPGDNARSADISSDRKRGIVGYLSGRINVLDMETGQTVCTLNGHTNSVNSVRFLPDGKSAASGSNDYTVILWDLSSCKKDRVLFQHNGWVMALAFSPDGSLLASASADGTTIVWNLESNQIAYRLQIPEIDINSGLDGMELSLDFSPDGHLLTTGSANGGLAVWSVANGVLLRRFILNPLTSCKYGEHCFWVLSTKFTTSGDSVWASSADGMIRAWPLIQTTNIPDLRHWLLQSRYIHTLTEQEKESYGIGQ